MLRFLRFSYLVSVLEWNLLRNLLRFPYIHWFFHVHIHKDKNCLWCPVDYHVLLRWSNLSDRSLLQKSHSHLSHKVSGYYHVLLPALQVYSLPHESLHHFLLRYNYSSYNYRSDLPRKTAVSEHLLLLLYPVSLIICIYLLHLILQTDPSHHLNPCLIQLSLPVQLAFLPDIFLVPLRYKKKSLQYLQCLKCHRYIF